MNQGVIRGLDVSHLPPFHEFYRGKVRDVYTVHPPEGGKKLVMIVTDRISAFDVVLASCIPHKGQVLTQIAQHFLEATRDIVPNWLESVPTPNVMVGKPLEPIKVEMVIRGYITGSAWRLYENGDRQICGITLPDGLQENQRFDSPIITPTSKADHGHDVNMSKEEILAAGLVSAEEYEKLEQYTYALFERGQQMAAERGLILVDTKYEFGKDEQGNIYLIDEVHTPDSSRYWFSSTYEKCFSRGAKQNQLSKEFVREYLSDNGFKGQDGVPPPQLPEEVIYAVSKKYIELYEIITGKTFQSERFVNGDEYTGLVIQPALLIAAGQSFVMG